MKLPDAWPLCRQWDDEYDARLSESSGWAEDIARAADAKYSTRPEYRERQS